MLAVCGARCAVRGVRCAVCLLFLLNGAAIARHLVVDGPTRASAFFGGREGCNKGEALSQQIKWLRGAEGRESGGHAAEYIPLLMLMRRVLAEYIQRFLQK